MTNKEILIRAIEKAQLKHYQAPFNVLWVRKYNEWTLKGFWFENGMEYEDYQAYDIRGIIFSHEFAQAFWGERISKGYLVREEGWKYHLQKMVIEKKPLKYLEKFLK